MEEEYAHIEFHNLNEISDQASLAGRFVFEGLPCVDCKNHCPGFARHAFRHVCAHCKCTPARHDMVLKNIGHPFLRMNVEESDPPQHSEYDVAATINDQPLAWVPRGLNPEQIGTYMQKIDHHLVPAGEGLAHRHQQLMKQLPLQDFHLEHLHTIQKNSENVFKFLARKRVEGSVGVGAVKAELAGSGHCSGCGEEVGPHDMVVFTERLGHEHYWHPGCFKCAHDDEPLVDLIYFSHGDNIYCGRHYHEQTKPRCFGCDELVIKGGYIKAMNEAWHSEHFCCWGCDIPLSGEKYIPSGDQPLCNDCYNKKHSHICDNCHHYIGAGDKDLLVRDKHFHEDCFKCHHCKNVLQNAEFSFLEEKLVCHHCRHIDIEKCMSCFLCHDGFESGQKKVGVGGVYYHEGCFTCTDCSVPISEKTFVRKSDERQLCNECFHKTAKICNKCEVPIKGATLNMGDRYFHANCFECHHCHQQLDEHCDKDGHESDSGNEWDCEDGEFQYGKTSSKGVPFYTHDEEPYCEECYLIQHAKRCGKCFKPICASTKYVEQDQQFWHSKCFVCSSCNLRLAGGVKFISRDGDRLCVDCK